MNEVTLNIESLAQHAKENWFKQKSKRRGFRQLIEDSVPSWIVIVALALFALSAPHTTKMFDMITPGWGWAGIFLCEFGLLYIAFRRKAESKRDGTIPRAIWVLEALLFITAILVNGSGALIAVVSSAGIATLSASTIFSGIGTMPIVAQVGLVLVPLAALIIPIGTVVAGEGLASHVLDGKRIKMDLDQEWAGIEESEVYKAALSYLIRGGVNARDAKRRADSATKNLYNRDYSPQSIRIEQEMPMQSGADMPFVNAARTILRTDGRTSSTRRQPNARKTVREYLEAHPEDAEKSSGQIRDMLGVSKTIAWEEIKKFKQQ